MLSLVFYINQLFLNHPWFNSNLSSIFEISKLILKTFYLRSFKFGYFAYNILLKLS